MGKFTYKIDNNITSKLSENFPQKLGENISSELSVAIPQDLSVPFVKKDQKTSQCGIDLKYTYVVLVLIILQIFYRSRELIISKGRNSLTWCIHYCKLKGMLMHILLDNRDRQNKERSEPKDVIDSD